MGISVSGNYINSRGASLSSMISSYISRKQESINALYQQKDAIEQMYQNVASGLYTTNSQIYQMNQYYNTQIIAKNSTINTLNTQINLAKNRISVLNSVQNSYKNTVTSLDDFLKSIKESANTSSQIDFSNTNESALDVEIRNNKTVSTNRYEYNIKQTATATKVNSKTLNGGAINLQSKLTDLFAGTYDGSKLTGTRTDLSASMTMSQLGIKEGYFNIGDTTIYVSKNDTVKDFADKLKADGYDAGISNGQFYIDANNVKSMNIHNQESDIAEVLGLTISKGNFSINGKDITIDSNTTINSLMNTINTDSDYGVGASFVNNQLMLVANKTGNVLIEINKGSSNITNVLGFTLGGQMNTSGMTLGSDGLEASLTGAKGISSVTGNISGGQFNITKNNNGTTTTQTITFTQGANLNETLNNVINQINSSTLGLTAEIKDDKFVIRNTEKGGGVSISVEAGSSDFTEKVGLTENLIETGILNPGADAQQFTKITGLTEITNPLGVNVTAGSFKINNITINLTAGTMESAINQINTYTNSTGVMAEIVGNKVVLRNQMTGNKNLYIEGGTSSFGEIAGLTSATGNIAAATIGQVGSKSTLTGSEFVNGNTMIEASSININGTVVNINAGKLSDVIAQVNRDYADITKVTLSLNTTTNKLVITETRNGELPVTVTDISGNFAQITGISGYKISAGTEEKYGSSRSTYTTTKNVSNSTQILESVVKVNGKSILLSGTIADAIKTINSNTSTTGVEAYIDSNNKFVLRNVNTGNAAINFTVTSGDFGRVVGTGTYTTTTGTNSHQDKQLAEVTGAIGGLDEYSQVLAGSKMQIGDTIIDLGASVGAALLAINNNKDRTGIEALLNSSGQFVLRATNDEIANISFSVIGTGDFGRVTGLGSYTVGAAESNGDVINQTYSKITGVNNVNLNTQITASNITLSFVNDMGTNVSKTFSLKDGSLEEAMKVINDANWYVKAEINNNKLEFVSRSAGPFQIGVSVNAIEGVTGDFGRVVGMANNRTSAGSTSHHGKEGAVYVGATSGLNATDEIIGTNTIKLWMSRNNASTGNNTEEGSGSLSSVAQTITFTDKDGDGRISIQDAIDSINDVKGVTKIEASLEGGQFVLRQTDANTAGEGDTINFTLSGNGDFARVAGYGSYTTIGQSNTGTVSGQSHTTLTGSRDITTSNEVLKSTISLSVKKASALNSAGVDLKVNLTIEDGTMQNAINSINNQLRQAGIAVTASINNGKLEFKSDMAGDYNISVNMDNSDFGRVVGIGTHTTYDGNATSMEKTAAKVTGGVGGLTLDSQIIGNVELTLQGLKTRTTTGVNTEGGTNNNASSVKTISLSGTIGDAINAINAQTNVTQIKAYLDSQGRFILEQTNQNTDNEFDTISFSVSGTGDFGAITGLGAYTAYGQESTGSSSGQTNSYIAGVTSALKGTEQITAGTATITFTDSVSSWDTPNTTTFTVDLSGTVQNAAEQITAKARELGLSLEAYIDESNGRFTIKSTSYGPDKISISVADSDFARITGIANYTMDYAQVTGGNSTYDMHPVIFGGKEITGDTHVLSGTLKIGNHTISTTDKTIEQIVQEVNSLGLSGVTADIDAGVFRIKMLESTVSNPYSVEATGDFARLTGLATYTVGAASYVDGSYTISDGTPSYQTKSAMGLKSNTSFAGGNITISHSDGKGATASFTIDTTGKTVQQIVNEINTIGQSGTSVNSPDGYSLNYVYAEYSNEQIVIRTNENDHSITATGDFARVTGFSAYKSDISTNTGSSTNVEQGTLQFQSQNKTTLNASTTFASGTLSVTFENGINGNVTVSTDTKGKTVEQVLTALQAQADIYYAETSKDGYITSRPKFSFDSANGKITIDTYGSNHSVNATGDAARLTGFGDYTTGKAVNSAGSVNIVDGKYVYTNGKLTGSTNVYNTSQGALLNQSGFIDFYNGTEKIGFIKVDEGDDLQTIVNKINNLTLNFNAPDDKPSQNLSYKLNASINSSGNIEISYTGALSDFSVSGTSSTVDFYGLGKTSQNTVTDYTNNIYETKEIITYNKDGYLTGGTDISTVNGNAIYGQAGTIDFFNGNIKIGSVTIDDNDDLNTVLDKINNMTINYTAPSDKFNIDWDASITASIVDNKIQLNYGAGMQDLKISGSSSFVYFYGLGSTATELNDRSTSYHVQNEKDVYIYSNGSITGSVDVKEMLNGGSLSVGNTGITPFTGQKTGMLSFVTTVNGEKKVIGNVEVLATDSLDEVMNKINHMIASDAITPDGVEINKINGFTASFTADGKIQITYGGQQGAVRIEDTSGFAQYYGLTDLASVWQDTSIKSEMERPYPDRVGESVVTGSSTGYNANSVIGGLQSGSFSVSINGKSVVVNYSNTESISSIMDKLVALANQTDGSGLFDYNGELDLNIDKLTDDKLTYSINSQGQIVITSAVESRTLDNLVISDISGNFAKLSGIATAPEGYTEGSAPTPSNTPGIVTSGTKYIVTTYEGTGSHGSFNYTGATINGLSGDSVITGLKNGGFYINTTQGSQWITVNKTDTVNDVLSRINALNPSINAVFDEQNDRITITSKDFALSEISITGDTSGFIQRAGLSKTNLSYDTNYTNLKESLGHSKLTGSVGNLHTSHILGNIQGGVNGATETITINSASGSVNITVSDDESLDSVINKIKQTGQYDAGITDGKFWIKSTADSEKNVTVSDSNFARILGLNGDSETLGTGTLNTGSYGTMNYTGASVAGLNGSSNLTIDDSITGTGDGSIRITLGDKNSNTINITSKSFDVAITKDMTVDQIMTAIKTSAVNAGVENFNISFDSSTSQVKISVSGNQAEQITFSGINDKGTELIKRLGLATSNSTTTLTPNHTAETSGTARLTGSVSNLHGEHILGNLKSETFTISGADGSVNVAITSGQSLAQIVASINSQTGGKYTANIDSQGRFYIESKTQSTNGVSVTSTDFTRRVGLVASNTTEGSSNQTSSGDHGIFLFKGAGGSGGSGIDGMKGSTVFSGLRTGSFTFTLGATNYSAKRSYTVNVSSSDSIDTILNKMKQKVVAGGNVDQSKIDFHVEVDNSTGKGRIYIQMAGKDASEITFSNDTSGFITMAGMSNTGATTNPNYTSQNRTYGKSILTGSVTGLDASHVFGNMQTGTMILSAGSTSKTINIAATDSITDIINKIKQGGTFDAGIDENGSFYVKTTADNSANISASGTSDFYKLTGLNSGTWTSTASQTQGSYGNSKITGSVTGLTSNQKFENMTSGNFSISAAGHRTLNVSVTQGVTTVQNVIDYINNNSNSDFEAKLDTTTGQIVLNTKISNGATISVQDGTSNYAQILGLTSGNVDSKASSFTGKNDIYSTLTGTTTGLDSNATFTAGDFTISVTNPSGTTTSKTFTLNGTESLTEVAALITNSSLGVKASLDPYNNNLVFESKVSGEYRIAITDGTSNFAEATGFTKNNAQIQQAELGTVSKLTSSKTEQNAAALGFTSGTFNVSLTDTNGNITNTKTITINSTDSVSDIAKLITNSGIGVTATIDSTTGQMVLTRNSSAQAGGISVSKGTSDFTNKIGFTDGGTLSSSAQINTGSDATKTILESQNVTATRTTKLASLGITEGTFKINGSAISVDASDTISSLIDKINASFNSSDPNGVTADFQNNKIILTSNIAADNARITVESGSSNFTDIFGFTNATSLNAVLQAKGDNAKYTINGTDYESKSNIISLDANGNIVETDSADEALRFTIKAIGTGTVDIGKQSLTDAFLKLNTFVNRFNMSMALSQNTTLTQDSGFVSLLQTIQNALTNPVGSYTQMQKELSDIGIIVSSTTLTSTGASKTIITLNEDKFVSAFMNNSNKVISLLVGDETQPIDTTKAGSFTRLKDTLDNSLDPITGYFEANKRITGAQQKAMEKDLAITRGELAQLEAELSINAGDEALAQNQKDLEEFLEGISKQYREVNDLLNKLNRQYTQSLSVLVINKNNPSFG